jgi:hypothetical protein
MRERASACSPLLRGGGDDQSLQARPADLVAAQVQLGDDAVGLDRLGQVLNLRIVDA